MIDIFLQEDTRNLLKNKSIVFMGDSNVRALYKDLLCLLTHSKLIPKRVLKTKMENTVYGDTLANHRERTNGRNYMEERKAHLNDTNVQMYFLTQVYNAYVEEVLRKISKAHRPPDIIIVNSCLWDITRWGPNGVRDFKRNLKSLMEKLKKMMPDTLVIWVTAPPLSVELKGGFLVKELQFLRYSLRFHVVEANHYAKKVVVANGFDVLDSHYHLKSQIHRREGDGIHWSSEAVRYVTNLLLTHISLAWNIPLPHRFMSEVMKNTLKEVTGEEIIEPMQHASKDEPSPPVQPPPKTIPMQNSHHAFMKRKTKNERRNKIRKWQPISQPPTPGPYRSPVPSYQNNLVSDMPFTYHSHYESRYMPSQNYNTNIMNPYTPQPMLPLNNAYPRRYYPQPSYNVPHPYAFSEPGMQPQINFASSQNPNAYYFW